MIKLISLIFILISTNAHALKIKLPTSEAVTHLIYSRDIAHSRNYSYDVDFIIPYNKVSIYIKLKAGGVENFLERENLANNILVYIRHLKKKHKLTSLSAQVYYEKD